MLLDIKKNDIQMQGILNSLDDCAILAVTDVNGTILSVNQLFCDISGYRREELIGRNHRILSSGFHTPEFFKELWGTIRNGQIWTGEIQNQTKMGHPYWVHTVISPILDSFGEVVEFLAVRFDITNQKNKEKKFHDTSKRLEAALETSGSGTWDFNLQTKQMSVSESLLKVVCGSKQVEISNLDKFLSFVHPEDRALLKETIDNTITLKSSFNIDYRLLPLDNNEKWLNCCGEYVHSDFNIPNQLRAIVVDITNKKIAETTKLILTSSSKMTTLGEMACGIIHEINNPLSIILGRISLINYELNENVSPDLDMFRDSFKTIESAVHRMRGITKGLGSYALNATNDPMLQIQIADLPIELEDILRENFRLNSVELRINIKEVEDVIVLGRYAQLLQVFLNLLSNALDAVKGSELAWVEVKGFRNSQNVVLKITDSGLGIPPEIASRIMQPFYTTKKLGEGTGLGLSISKSIIEEHGGTLSFDETSFNTSFNVELPFL